MFFHELRSSRGALRLAALLVAAAVLAACSSNNNTTSNPSAIKPVASAGVATPAAPALSASIGAAFSLTGAAAQYGATQKNGAQIAVDQINAGAVPGLKLTLSIQDDASTKDQAITVFQQFITQDKVNAILGPTLSASAQAADPAAQQAKVPVLGVSNTGTGITSIGDFVFRDSLAEADVAPQVVKQTSAKLNYKTAGLIYASDDAFSTAGYQAYKAALDAAGIKIVDTEQVGTNDQDFSAQVTKLRDAKPDVIVVETLINAAVGITTQARQLGIQAPIIGGNGFNSPAFIKGTGPAGEGVMVGAAWNATSANAMGQKFIADYKAKYNSDPDQFAAQAYTGVFLLARAIQLGNSVDHQAIRDNLAKIQNFDTVLGSFSFNASRDAVHPGIVQVVKNGVFIPLQ